MDEMSESLQDEINEMISRDVENFRKACIVDSFGWKMKPIVKTTLSTKDTTHCYRKIVEKLIYKNGNLSFSELFDIMNSTYFESDKAKDKMNDKWVEKGIVKYGFDIRTPGKRLSFINYLSNQSNEEDLFIENWETKRENDPVIERIDETGLIIRSA